MKPSQGEERRKNEERKRGRKRKGGATLFCLIVMPV
jgi:hypothetical protein